MCSASSVWRLPLRTAQHVCACHVALESAYVYQRSLAYVMSHLCCPSQQMWVGQHCRAAMPNLSVTRISGLSNAGVHIQAHMHTRACTGTHKNGQHIRPAGALLCGFSQVNTCEGEKAAHESKHMCSCSLTSHTSLLQAPESKCGSAASSCHRFHLSSLPLSPWPKRVAGCSSSWRHTSGGEPGGACHEVEITAATAAQQQW